MLKKLYICLFFIGLFLSGCDRVTDLQPQPNLNEIIPPAAVNAIRQTYPTASKIRFSTIEKDKVFQSDFELKVDKMSAIVNHLGVISEMYRQTAEVSLPENVKTYISSNYPDATIINVCQQINKDDVIIGYKVTIKSKDGNNVLLIFDATGTLTLLVSNDTNGNQPIGKKPPKIYFIEKSELPQVIKDFLTTKHGDYTCIKAAVVLDTDVKNYSVVISKDLITYDYLFDEKGNVLRSASFGVNAPADRIEVKPLNINDLPATIKSYLDKEFKGWIFERGIYFSQNNNIQAYNVLITYDRKQYSIQFDEKGNFVKKEQVGNDGKGGNKYEVKMVLPKDLPNSITAYLASKHSDFKYIQSSIIIEKDKKTYWITILIDNTTYDYTFDEQGKFLAVKEIKLKLPDNHITQKPLGQNEIPAKAKNYLDKTFGGWVFQKAVTVFDENKILGYIIAIQVGNNYYYISFDVNANFLAARRG